MYVRDVGSPLSLHLHIKETSSSCLQESRHWTSVLNHTTVGVDNLRLRGHWERLDLCLAIEKWLHLIDQREKRLCDHQREMNLAWHHEIRQTISNLPQTLAQRNYRVDKVVHILPNIDSSYFRPAVLLNMNLVLVSPLCMNYCHSAPDPLRPHCAQHSCNPTHTSIAGAPDCTEFLCSNFDLTICGIAIYVDEYLCYHFRSFNGAEEDLRLRKLKLTPFAFNGTGNIVNQQMLRIWKYITRGYRW